MKKEVTGPADKKGKNGKAYEKEVFSLLAMSDNLKIAEGYLVFREIGWLRIGYSIYNQDFISFSKVLDSYYHLQQTERNLNKLKRRVIQKKLLKHFQHALLSGRTFLDHAGKGELKSHFHCFMRELRNFVLHEQILPIVSNKQYAKDEEHDYRESFNSKPFHDYLVTRIQEREGKGRNVPGVRKALDYLKNQEELSLSTISCDYHEEIERIYLQVLLKKYQKNKTELLKFMNDAQAVLKKSADLGNWGQLPITDAELRYLILLTRKLST